VNGSLLFWLEHMSIFRVALLYSLKLTGCVTILGCKVYERVVSVASVPSYLFVCSLQLMSCVIFFDGQAVDRRTDQGSKEILTRGMILRSYFLIQGSLHTCLWILLIFFDN
jgi:hypothetical protein